MEVLPTLGGRIVTVLYSILAMDESAGRRALHAPRVPGRPP